MKSRVLTTRPSGRMGEWSRQRSSHKPSPRDCGSIPVSSIIGLCSSGLWLFFHRVEHQTVADRLSQQHRTPKQPGAAHAFSTTRRHLFTHRCVPPVEVASSFPEELAQSTVQDPPKLRSRADGIATVVGPKFTRTDGVEVSVSRRVQGSKPNSRSYFLGRRPRL